MGVACEWCIHVYTLVFVQGSRAASHGVQEEGCFGVNMMHHTTLLASS